MERSDIFWIQNGGNRIQLVVRIHAAYSGLRGKFQQGKPHRIPVVDPGQSRKHGIIGGPADPLCPISPGLYGVLKFLLALTVLIIRKAVKDLVKALAALPLIGTAKIPDGSQLLFCDLLKVLFKNILTENHQKLSVPVYRQI